jgi:ribosomal protein S18 acetylase RimI-like enzyme
MFFCNIIREKINNSNIDKWEKKLKFLSLNNLQRKNLRRYEVEDLNEYINLIKDSINDPSKLETINEVYNKNKEIDILKEKNQEKERLKKIIKNSLKYKDKNIKIRLLSKNYKNKAGALYIKFKILMDEDIEEALDNIDDFILKNIIYGIFENNELAGIIILENSRLFKFNDLPEKINTFYIQELIIDDKYKGKGYGNLLINYAILICPENNEYISFMTMPTNEQMIKIAKKFNFVLQLHSSGDKKHSLLYIRNNDKIERELYKNLAYIKSKSSVISSASP